MTLAYSPCERRDRVAEAPLRQESVTLSLVLSFTQTIIPSDHRPPPPCRAGIPPFNADTPEQIFENILDRRIEWPDDPEDMSPECMDLIDKLLEPEFKKRLGHRGAGKGEGQDAGRGGTGVDGCIKCQGSKGAGG